jgi:hypothetical protein
MNQMNEKKNLLMQNLLLLDFLDARGYKKSKIFFDKDSICYM